MRNKHLKLLVIRHLVIIILTILAILLLNVGDKISPPCIRPTVSTWGMAIFIFLILQLLWPFLAKVSITIGLIKVDLNSTISKPEEPHSSPRFDGRIIVLLIFFLVAGIYVYNYPPRVFRPFENPVVLGFSVIYLKRDESKLNLKPESEIKIKSDENIRVEVATEETTEPHQCTWYIAKEDSETVGCSIEYNAPPGEQDAILAIHVKSPCNTKGVYSFLRVKVVDAPK